MKPLSLTLFVTALMLIGCETNLTEDNRRVLSEMALTKSTVLPKSPTNKYADDLIAADLGYNIFFDKRMSSDGSTACGSCHIAEQGWSDDREVSLGVADAMGGRHSMPSHTIAFQDFFFWDGRADSAWSQALQAIESSAEMDFPREKVAQYIYDHRLEAYEKVFGAIPTDFLNSPNTVNRIFANVGKSLEAYQRRLVCSDTAFDRWTIGEVQMTSQQETGAAIFVQEGCADCHGGVAFSNGRFHELGIASQFDGDNGRLDGLTSLLDNPFNGAGRYSDDRDFGTDKIVRAMEENRVENAYKTPSLRGVAQRGGFGHGGMHMSLAAFVRNTYNGGRNRRNGGLDPQLRGVNIGGDDEEVVAFLEMLDCPDVDPRWSTPDNFVP